jgi:hypothetical protein
MYTDGDGNHRDGWCPAEGAKPEYSCDTCGHRFALKRAVKN